MSLFKIRQFWTTTSEDDEYFDQNSLIISKLNSDFDYVITASQSGVLRIFNPNSELSENGAYKGFQPNDLIVEKIFDSPVIQISSGKLVSGNHSTHLAVLHPSLLSVYSLIFKAGKADYGNNSYLQLLYEHKLRRPAANFVVGPFGGSQNRDFICIQSLDGILTFFEQESQVSYVALPDFLLPAPLSYIIKTDSFLTVRSDWNLVNYRYKALLEAADESTDPIYSRPKLMSEWIYNLGESVIDIQVINDTVQKETWIIVLGERNLFCLGENGGRKLMKKLDYCPICMHTYVIDTNLFTIVVADMNMLLVYENTSLKWSAQVDCLPVAIHRAFFETIKGGLVLLTDEGRLECCYLGTEPNFFVAPPLNLQEINFEKAEQELLDLEKLLTNANNTDVTLQNNVEKELQVNVSVNSQIEVCTYEHNIKNAASTYMCRVNVDLACHVMFQEVQVSICVHRPLKAEPSINFFSNLGDNTSISSYIFLNEAHDVPSLEVEVRVSVITSLGVPRTVTKMIFLPIALVLETTSPEKENKHKVTLVVNQPPVGLSNLFPECNGNQFSPNAIAFKSACGNIGTILLAKSTEKYRIQSDTFTMLSILLEQLSLRLKKYFCNVGDFRITYSSPLPNNEVFTYVINHFKVKQLVKEQQVHLSQLSTQFRLIQKRLLAKYRAKNPISLKSLELLLDDTYVDIMETTEKLDKEKENLTKCQIDLSCVLCLVKQLISFLDIDLELLNMMNSVCCLGVYDLDVQSMFRVFEGAVQPFSTLNRIKAIRAMDSSDEELPEAILKTADEVNSELLPAKSRVDTNLFTIVVADMNMLLVYENTSLKWSAQVDCLPVAIHRAFFETIKGGLVLLTDEGRLECCYLGTEPNFFVAPPLNLQEINFEKAEQELLDLEKLLTNANNTDVTLQNNVEKELQVNVSVNSQIEVCTYEHNIKNAASTYMCRVNVDLACHVMFQEVQVSICVHRPLKAEPSINFFSNLGDNTSISSYIFLNEAHDVPSLEVEVRVSVITSLGVPRTVTKMIFLPIALVLETTSPEKENKHKVTLVVNQPPVGLSNLFPECNGNQFSPNAIAFKSACGNIGTILLAKSTEKYRIQSDTFTMLSILLEQLSLRLKKYFCNVGDFRITYSSPLPNNEVFTYVINHFKVKQLVKEQQVHLSQLSTQFRLIQKRLLAKYRAKNPISLKSLELLLDDTYVDIMETTEKLDKEKENLTKCQIDLSCVLCLVKQLISFLDIDLELLNMMNSVCCLGVYDLDVQAWEDVIEASLSYLLRTAMAKTEKDRLRAPHTSFDEVKDLSKFEKHLSQVLERLVKQNTSKELDGVFEDEGSDVKNSPEAMEEPKHEKPIGSQYGEFSSRLLSARKSLMKRHKLSKPEDNAGSSGDGK